jgi:hypothetical protein
VFEPIRKPGHSSAIRLGAVCLLWCAALLMAMPMAPGAESVAKQILALTEARTKVVWARSIGQKDHWAIMGFDTDDDRERILVAGTATWHHAFITANGKRVVYGEDKTVKIVDWNGKNARTLCAANFPAAVAEDAAGVEWVYVLMGEMPGSLYRHRIDKPEVREVVWDKTGTDCFWTLTRDGRYGVAGLPWPTVGLAELPNGSWRKIGGGCGQSLAADLSHIFHFRPDHQGVLMYDKDGANPRYIDFSHAPGIDGNRVHYPVWAHYDPRFFTVTGPQALDAQHTAPPAFVLFGQFNDSFTDVAKWVKVTNSTQGGDTGSYAWIQPDLGEGEIPKPTAGLEAKLKLLAAMVTRLERAGRLKPVLDEVRKRIESAKKPEEADEAKTIIAHIETWGRRQLALARDFEVRNTRAAETRYKLLAVKLEGEEAGTAAQARLKAQDFQDLLKAWALVEKLQKAEGEIEEVPGAGASAKDAKFAAKNKRALAAMTLAAKGLGELYPGSAVIPIANTILMRFDLEPLAVKAAEPEPVAKTEAAETTKAAAAKPPEGWPSDRTGLLFAWETKAGTVVAFDRAGKPLPALTLTPRGLARLDRFFAMGTTGGSFVADQASAYLAIRWRKANGLGLEAWLTPAGLADEGTDIIAFASGPDDYGFVLGQRGDKLTFGLRTADGAAQGLELATLVPGKACHIAVSYTSGTLACYLDGQPARTVATITGGFANWPDHHLIFGDSWVRRRAWAGTMEGVALFERGLTAPEVQRDHALYQAKVALRKGVGRLEVQARLVTRSPVPAYEEIAPYYQALVVYEYEIEKILAGSCARKRIRVVHWGMMDKNPLPIAQAAIDQSCHLLLERFADHPQLQNDYLSDGLPADADAPLYYAINQ